MRDDLSPQIKKVKVGKVKSHTGQGGPHGRFLKHEATESIATPPLDGTLVHRRVIPSSMLPILSLYTWVERDNVRQSMLSKGRYVFSWRGRAGASEGRVIDESEHQKGRAIPHVSYSREGHTSFPEFFNENFCDDAFHFSYRLSFSFHLL